MRERFLGSMIRVAIAAAAAGAVILVPITRTQAQAPLSSATAPAPTLKTPWGEPDLQGIWTDETDTPLQRPAKYSNQEFFTETQREEIDRERSALLARDTRAERGTERDVNGSYNSVFLSVKRIGARTSKIVDPPNGRLPSLTPEAQKAAAADRDFHLALLQATETCKNKSVGCIGGKYDPTPSPRRAELPPRYNTQHINRDDGPEDHWPNDRCLTGGLPEFGTAFGGSFRRIVQTPGGIAIFYDVGQGQGWQRNVVMNGSPHLPDSVRQWYGDSRGHWEGNSLVVDVTNFSPKTDFRGARENLHLVERWTRTARSGNRTGPLTSVAAPRTKSGDPSSSNARLSASCHHASGWKPNSMVRTGCVQTWGKASFKLKGRVASRSSISSRSPSCWAITSAPNESSLTAIRG
jgi:hypothetical protein